LLLALFLVSVAVMELILRRDEKQPRQPRSDRSESGANTAAPKPETTAADLLALAKMMPVERPAEVPRCGAKAPFSAVAQNAPEYNREDVRSE
jgi:hypothetical protein